MSLYHLGLIGSILSTVSYAESSLRMLRATNWFTGVLGGVVAARAFCALVFAGYAVPALGLGFLVTLGLVLPSLTGLLWPFLGAKAQAPPN